MNVILTLLYYTVKMSTPLLFVIMGGVFVQRAGVFNFALESAINTGAFAAIAVIMVTNNLLAGIIGGFAQHMSIGKIQCASHRCRYGNQPAHCSHHSLPDDGIV